MKVSQVAAQCGGVERRAFVPLWLIILIVGVVLVILGFPLGHLLLWIGIIVLVVAIILGFVGRGRSRT